VKQANDTHYGLTGSVGRATGHGHRTARQLNVGVASGRSRGVVGVQALPWGGVSDSGYGARAGVTACST
jgi:acyl-CoA reductase-like NAD-dependent aldehyde dehydrogenase